jgi:ubiquinone/menaquinone biosynthesis C-methylase UbiE
LIGMGEDPVIKTKHRAMWALGNYAAVASDLIAALGEDLVAACGIREGQRVLDVAAGSGNAAIPAARRGATVVASDLTPELLEVGEKLAAERGLKLDWRVEDAEALSFADGSFDVVMSCVGVMFAPFHQRGADELVRVTRSGGTIGLVNWTPEGFIGQMFATMKPFAAPPPPGAQPPPLWGDPSHLATLFGDRVTDVKAERKTVHIGHFPTAEAFREYFKQNYGPTIAAYRNLADDPQRTQELDEALADLGRRHDLGGGAMEWEYLRYTAVKA